MTQKSEERRNAGGKAAMKHPHNGKDKKVENGTLPGAQNEWRCVKLLSSGKSFFFFRDAINEAKERFPHYLSDFTDGLQPSTIKTIIFMFLACVAPTITFGGLLGRYTNEAMGTMETLLAQAIIGVLWGLFSCQPIIIQSITGPILIFEASLYRLCQHADLDLLTVRFFAGWFIFLICIVTVAFNGSQLSRYVTRFTDEIFAVLITIIFCSESIMFVVKTFIDNPVENYEYYAHEHEMCNQTETEVSMRPCHFGEPNTSLLTMVIMFFTFGLSISLNAVQRSVFFGKHKNKVAYIEVRNVFADFGVFFAISGIALIAQLLFPHPNLQRLEMPNQLNFTNLAQRNHGLFVFPDFSRGSPAAAIGIAAIAAIFVFILIFVETEITELLLMRKERGLVKGSGLNWDLALAGVCCLLCSLVGFPWMCAGAVQSLAHCSSLSRLTKGKINPRNFVVKSVREQRVTAIAVSFLVGGFALIGSLFRIPMASLFGVFLYLGVMNLRGVQLVRRITLFFTPTKYYPERVFVKGTSTEKMHAYTIIQVILVIIIVVVKQVHMTALAFPFVLILFVVFRYTIIPLFFNHADLAALDNEQDTLRNPEEETNIEGEVTDIYAVAHDV